MKRALSARQRDYSAGKKEKVLEGLPRKVGGDMMQVVF